MATTLTDDAPALTYMSFPIDKARTRVTADGDVEIFGKATDGIIDSDDQIVDPVWAAKAVSDWLITGGNVRVQHQAMRDPAGKGLEVTHDEMGGQWVKALIVEPVAKNLVLKGVLRSYSIGIMHPIIVPDQLARNGRIIGGEMGELSLVDRPANKNCRFELVKSAKDGVAQWVGKMFGNSASPAYVAAVSAAKRGVAVTDADKVGPHGFEHDWVYVGGPGLPKPGSHDAPQAADASHAVTAGHAADHVMTGQKKVKELSDKDLRDADKEFSRRAAILGKPGQISSSHRKVKNEITRRAGKKNAEIDLGKRDFDPNVGGGVDRDALSDADFAGPDRSFPIVSPQDVADIAPNLNHTKHDPEQVKRNAIRIAERKGPAFEAKIPDSWKKGSMADETTTKGEGTPCGLCKGKGKIRKGKMTCPDCHGDGSMSASDSADKSVLGGLVLKAGSACAHCDEFNDADQPTCTKCGAKMAAGDDEDTLDKALFGEMIVPYIDKAADSADDDDDDDDGPGDAGDDSMDDDDDDDDSSNDDDDDKDKSDSSEKTVVEPEIVKGKMKCAKCSGFMKAKQKFCPGCGAKKADAPAMGKSARTEPTPGDGVTGQHTEPVPSHREPDGKAVEAFEADAKIPTDPDAEYKTAMHHQMLGVPGDMALLHDLLCPVYHPAVTEKSYPNVSLADAVDVDEWQMKAMEAAASATLEEAQAATTMWKEASTLAQTDAETINEIRHHAFKAFQDANIGPGTFPTPTSITPGMFKRPYITGGHARPSFQQAGPNTASVPTGQISASQFDRGYITGGHAQESPANKGDQGGVSAPEVTGKPQRMFYSNAQKDNAIQAVRQMHDHISRLFPDICGLGGETAPAPKTDTAPAVGKAAKKQKAAKAAVVETAHGALSVDEVREGLGEPADALTKAFTPDAFKAAFTSATVELTNQLAEANARMKRQDKEIKRLNKAVGTLANMPDPHTAPFRGLAQPGALKSYGAQAASPSPAEIAARTQLSLMADLENDFRTSRDPSAREAAWNQICKMRGIAN